MSEISVVAIQKLDVLMEDFTWVKSLMKDAALNRKKLLDTRNSWEIIFAEYENDPREIPEIPEVGNWVKQSIEEGIPWFYFMRCTPDSIGLRLFMIIYGSEENPNAPGHYLFDRDKIIEFINKNFMNLNRFVDQYGISDDICREISDNVTKYITGVLTGSFNQAADDSEMERNKQISEALGRLADLEKIYGLNPKVRKYFQEGRLYYSYLTGGYIGSIDTINYDQRYADIVEEFEEQTSYLVYHVIEHKNTLSLLFVSDDYSNWQDERPKKTGVLAQVIDIDSYDNECGYITLDILQGALRRRDSNVYSDLPGKSEDDYEISEMDSEVIERIEILKNAGLFTDINLADIYTLEDEMCFSELHSIMGTKVCVVNRISANPTYQKFAAALSKQVPQTLYFMMVSQDHKLAFLYVSEDEDVWDIEKLALEKGRPYAIIVDPKNMTASIERISYQMVNGGPLCLLI